MKNTLVIRADASSQIGAGHIMRCLALAQAWQDAGGRCVFVVAMDAGPIFERLAQEHLEVVRIKADPGSSEDATITAELAVKAHSQWLILDGYHFTPEYQKLIKNAKLKLLVIDDNCEQKHYYADYILNQNIHASESMYPREKREPYTKLLLGTKYCLLRREFLKYKDFQRQIPSKARKVLVTMGGGDADNVTQKVIQALQGVDISDLEVKVVVGPANQNIEKLQKELTFSPFTFYLLPNVSDMPDLMAWADMAISAGGSTCWELAFMELPSILMTLSQDQKAIVDGLIQYGFTLKTEEPIEENITATLKAVMADREKRKVMSGQGRKLVDGNGAHRVVKIIMEAIK